MLDHGVLSREEYDAHVRSLELFEQALSSPDGAEDIAQSYSSKRRKRTSRSRRKDGDSKKSLPAHSRTAGRSDPAGKSRRRREHRDSKSMTTDEVSKEREPSQFDALTGLFGSNTEEVSSGASVSPDVGVLVSLSDVNGYTPDQVKLLCERMMDPQAGVRIKTRNYRGRTYHGAFTGPAGVSWMSAKFELTREDALALGASMVEQHLITLVTDPSHASVFDPSFPSFYCFGALQDSTVTDATDLFRAVRDSNDLSDSSDDAWADVESASSIASVATSPSTRSAASSVEEDPVPLASSAGSELHRAMSMRQMNLWQRNTLRGKDMARVRHITTMDFSNSDKVHAYLDMLAGTDDLVHIVGFIVQDEILRGRDRILREEGVGVRLLRSVWEMESEEYIRAFKPMVKMVVKHTRKGRATLELDTERLGLTTTPSVGSIEENQETLISLVTQFLSLLKESREAFPLVFENILQKLYRTLTAVGQHQSELGLAYNEEAIRLFGAFLLLRFLCPVLVTPERFGLYKGEPPREVRRSLILVSKVLQAVANQSEFTEPYMEFANDFVHEAVPEVMSFVRRLVESERMESHGGRAPKLSSGRRKTTFGKMKAKLKR
jgi:GTPase-activator protein for Ras-like GTPase/Domain found in Dishevelled, Egl-10, and Pleckstrin (DEP)